MTDAHKAAALLLAAAARDEDPPAVSPHQPLLMGLTPNVKEKDPSTTSEEKKSTQEDEEAVDPTTTASRTSQTLQVDIHKPADASLVVGTTTATYTTATPPAPNQALHPAAAAAALFYSGIPPSLALFPPATAAVVPPYLGINVTGAGAPATTGQQSQQLQPQPAPIPPTHNIHTPFPLLEQVKRPNRGGVTQPFPEKLHKMLETCAQENKVHIVSFKHHGRAFAIHQPKLFITDIMPRFFKQSKLTSFQRQLNLYEFKRISQGPDVGAYYHELFLRGRPALAAHMKRIKIKGTTKTKNNPETEPNFYAMPPIEETHPLPGGKEGKPPSTVLPQRVLGPYGMYAPPPVGTTPSITFLAPQTGGQTFSNTTTGNQDERPTSPENAGASSAGAEAIAEASPTATVEV